MPVYTYLCGDCGHEFDEIVRSAAPDEARVYECRCGAQAERLPSIPSAARGNFGTARRSPTDKVQTFKFTGNKERE